MTTKILGHSRQDWLGAAFGIVVMLPAAFSFLVGVGVLASQCVTWIEVARWPPLTVLDQVSWWYGYRVTMDQFMGPHLGLNEIIRWFLQIPLAPWLMFLQPLAWITLWIMVLSWLWPA
jgi:hypothetical protein